MTAPTTRPTRLAVLMLLATVWLALVSGWAVPSARAEGDVLYGVLIMATKVDHPSQPPEELRSQAENMEAIFGYNQFRVLGQKREAVPKATEDWLVSSKQFLLHVDTKNAVPDGYALGLELKRDDRVIVSADVNLNRQRPLYIRGPFVGEGQLLILLMVL